MGKNKIKINTRNFADTLRSDENEKMKKKIGLEIDSDLNIKNLNN